MREVVGLVSGARLGIHAGWQAVVGQGGCGRAEPCQQRRRGHPSKALF